MKEMLAVLSLVICAVVAEPPAPYPPSGWRPSGPTFDLPQRGQQPPQKQQYLPPVDPRNQVTPNVQYGTPEGDVSVQGLPTQEQQPIFQASPVNGQQYAGPNFNFDIRNLDQRYKQAQFQSQQEKYREFERQRQIEAAQANANANRQPRPQVPRDFAARPTVATTEASTPKDEFRTTQASTTEVNYNQGEILEDDEAVLSQQKKEKVSVEVSRQNLQEYPGELYLSSLAQLQLQPQFVPLQQIRAPVYLQSQGASQKQIAEYDGPAHFSALPSVLAQQQLSQPQSAQQAFQNPGLLVANEPANPGYVVQQPLAQYQPTQYQPTQYQPAQYQPAQYQPSYQPVQPQVQPQLQPEPVVFQAPVQQHQPNYYAQPNQDAVAIQQPLAQYQPANSYQPQPQVQIASQFQAQPIALPQSLNQPTQFAQPQPDTEKNRDNQEDQEQDNNQDQYNNQPQQLYQQPFLIQPQPFSQYQPQQQNLLPAQLVNSNQDLNQYYQPQFLQQQFQGQVGQQQSFQGQDALQSGLDINQQGNDIDQKDETDADDEQDNGSTAVATAFGARTQPRMFTQYGAPFPVPKVQANPGYATTTESAVEEVTEPGPAVAQAVVSNGSRKSARLRNRRLRPVYAVDRSGRLVLAEQ